MRSGRSSCKDSKEFDQVAMLVLSKRDIAGAKENWPLYCEIIRMVCHYFVNIRSLAS